MEVTEYALLFLVSTVVLASGCTSVDEEESLNNSNNINETQSNSLMTNSSILSTDIISSNGIDGTLSAAGYAKFIEKPENNTLTIKQSFVDVSRSCKSSKIKVTPGSKSNNDETLKTSIEPVKDEIKPECIGRRNNPINSTGIKIKFKSLNSGKTIQFTYNQIKFSYTTKGEKNTATREVKIPDNIR